MRVSIRSQIVLAVFAVTTLLLLLVFTPAKSAVQPSLLYAIDNGDNELAAFSLEAQRVRLIGSLGGFGGLALAFCPPGGVAYTIGNPFDPDKAQLATLNLGTGAATAVGSPLPSGQSLDVMGMTCSPNGTLYAVGEFDTSNPDWNSLYTVDRQTGLFARIGPTGVLDVNNTQDACCNGFFMALAFAPDGTLYGANDFALYRIDTSTGNATHVVDFNGVTPLVMGLAIDTSGTFYIADYVPGSQIYTVDTSSGVVTSVLKTKLSFVHNIAFRTPQ